MILWLLALILLPLTYWHTYSVGYKEGVSNIEKTYLAKEIKLVGSYFDEQDNLQLNTFSCTPNDEDGDCSKKIIENYVSVSTHWLNYCKELSNTAFNENIGRAKALRESLDSIASTPLQMPTARCNDGDLSYSNTRSGTCSHHDGVNVWR